MASDWLSCLQAEDRPTLCTLCEGITITKLQQPGYYRHAPNRAALRVSASTCRLCALIEAQLYRQNASPEGMKLEFVPENEEDPDLCVVKLALLPDKLNQGMARGDGDGPVGFSRIGIWRKNSFWDAALSIAVEEGNVLGTPQDSGADGAFITGRTIASSAIPHDALFSVVHKWMQSCRQRHTLCTPTCADGHPLLPNRVVDVKQAGEDPCLVVTKRHQRGQYVALSHCWGGLQPLQTTLLTLDDRIQGIPMTEMPKTFQDAVVITRKLGIRYLWIDSLCIIQDSAQDWHHEASLMSSVYHNSELTISATTARDGTEGCFQPEQHDSIVRLPATFTAGAGQAFAIDNTTPVHSKVTVGALTHRAWTLQERCLSGRILHCCTGQWFWECCERQEAQSGTVDPGTYGTSSFRQQLGLMRRGFGGVYTFENFENYEDVPSVESEEDGSQHSQSVDISSEVQVQELNERNPGNDEPLDSKGSSPATKLTYPEARYTYQVDLRPERKDVLTKPVEVTETSDFDLYNTIDIATRLCQHKTWYDLVSEYSQRTLTRASDKLPALSGIADMINSITKDVYLAGHWQRELDRSLFWTVNFDVCDMLPTRPAKYRAPSWAWSSVDGGVFWDWPDLSPGIATMAPLEILKTGVELLTPDDNCFGEVTDGRVVVQGRIITVKWNEVAGAWVRSGSTSTKTSEHLRTFVPQTASQPLEFHDTAGELLGLWTCDDMLNSLLPTTSLTSSTTEDDLRILERNMPYCVYTAITKMRALTNNGMALNLTDALHVLPSELVCLCGPTRVYDKQWAINSGIEDKEGNPITGTLLRTDAIVLAKVDSDELTFRRVGSAVFGCWEELGAKEEVITIL